MLEASEGEVTPEIQAVLDAVDAWKAELDRDLEVKVDNCAALIKILQGRSALRKEEAARLAKRAKIDEAHADWLKGMVLGEFQAREIGPLETKRFRVAVAGNGGKQPLVITDEAALLADPLMVVVTRALDTAAVRAVLDAGQEVPGAHLGPRGQHLSIR